jgi:hypothetical protein
VGGTGQTIVSHVAVQICLEVKGRTQTRKRDPATEKMMIDFITNNT